MKPLVNEIFKMLQDKPKIKTTDNWPDENGLYSLSGIKKYMATKGYTTDMTDQAMYQISSSKEEQLQWTRIYNKKYKEYYPYYYAKLTDIELNALKEAYES